MPEIIVDADDFHTKNNRLDLLYQIKANVPAFKITLFTIVGLCSRSFLEKVKQIDWIDMCPHGFMHPTPRECENWSYETSLEYLKLIEPLGLTKIFKAPGWQISDGMYQALLEQGYAVADQAYNNERRPKGLKAYILDSPHKLHYHVQNVCGNGLEERFNELMSLTGDFKFIKEII